MVHPSGLRRPDNVKSEVEEVRKGVYVVKNAYVGDYEYFKGKTLIKDAGKDKTRNSSLPNDQNDREKKS